MNGDDCINFKYSACKIREFVRVWRIQDLSGGEPVPAIRVEFFLVHVIVLGIIVGYFFLQQAVILEIEGEEPVSEHDIVEDRPVVLLPDQRIDNDPVAVESDLQGTFGLVLQKGQQRGRSMPIQGMSGMPNQPRRGQQDQVFISDWFSRDGGE